MIQFPKPDVEQYFQTYRISHFAVSADEKRLYMDSNLNGQPNIWAMDLPGGYPFPLTYLNQSSQFIKADPEGRHLLTAFDRDGNENYHLYALPPEGAHRCLLYRQSRVTAVIMLIYPRMGNVCIITPVLAIRII